MLGTEGVEGSYHVMVTRVGMLNEWGHFVWFRSVTLEGASHIDLSLMDKRRIRTVATCHIQRGVCLFVCLFTLYNLNLSKYSQRHYWRGNCLAISAEHLEL